jgi:hypothetical protein
MAKRFTSTEIWSEDWFLEMPNEYKLFWYYMLSHCDHAGLFKVNVRSFSGLLEVKVSSDTALKYFNTGKERIRVVSDSIWLIEDFFVFQYGTTFNPNNKLHESIENLYNRQNIKMTSVRGLKDLKDRVKDKDKVKEIKGDARGKKIFATSFAENMAIFSDGSKQQLGKSQMLRLKLDDLKPEDVHKGLVT